MQPDAMPAGAAGSAPTMGGVAIEDVVGIKEQTFFEKLISAQSFWVTIALIIICLVLTFLVPQAAAFATPENIFNITRNFAFIGIMAIGMVAVIVTGGIDLSVGSLMGLVGVCAGILLEAGYPWWVGFGGGLIAGIIAGAVNGALIAYVGLSPFVVTLGMLSFARSLAVVLSQNRMIYKLGPGGEIFTKIGGGDISGSVHADLGADRAHDHHGAGAQVHHLGPTPLRNRRQ